jgi:hypothetical protein
MSRTFGASGRGFEECREVIDASQATPPAGARDTLGEAERPYQLECGSKPTTL